MTTTPNAPIAKPVAKAPAKPRKAAAKRGLSLIHI